MGIFFNAYYNVTRFHPVTSLFHYLWFMWNWLLNVAILYFVKTHKEQNKKNQVYVKYVDVRLVVLKIMFETDKLYFWWMRYICSTL